MTTIELVRHANAYRRDRWSDGPDSQRPLDEEGRRQAEALAAGLAGGSLVAVYSSPLTRCVQTVQPLADSLGLPVIDEPALAEASGVPVTDGGHAWVAAAWLGGRALAFVDRAVVEHAGQRVVACSHGDVIPALLALLVGRDELALSDVSCAKGGRYSLRFDGSRCVEAIAASIDDRMMR